MIENGETNETLPCGYIAVSNYEPEVGWMRYYTCEVLQRVQRNFYPCQKQLRKIAETELIGEGVFKAKTEEGEIYYIQLSYKKGKASYPKVILGWSYKKPLPNEAFTYQTWDESGDSCYDVKISKIPFVEEVEKVCKEIYQVKDKDCTYYIVVPTTW